MSVEVKVKRDERNRDVSIFFMTRLNIIEIEVYTLRSVSMLQAGRQRVNEALSLTK
jgi:hypothetical protein